MMRLVPMLTLGSALLTSGCYDAYGRVDPAATALIGAGVGALKNALAAALGPDLVRRTPVTLDIILNSLEAGKRVDEGLTTHI